MYVLKVTQISDLFIQIIITAVYCVISDVFAIVICFFIVLNARLFVESLNIFFTNLIFSKLLLYNH